MNIKTFIANSSQEALRKVKEEMGPEAVILKTRTLSPKGGAYGHVQEQIEVTAAIDYDASIVKRSEGSEAISRELMKKWSTLEDRLREISHFLMALEATTNKSEELNSLTIPRNHYVYYRHFGVMPENIKFIEATNKCNDISHAGAISRKELKQCLMDILRSVRIAKEPMNFKKQKIYAFVGPTGVGKTTTIAKLAAIYKMRKKLRVALVTVDTYRIGAVAQLQTYARIMGLPLEVADNSADLRGALERHRSADVILIDTAGRSPRSKEEVSKIGEALRVALPIHHYLVLSANTELSSMLAAEEVFGLLPIKSYIFTKLDETADGSEMLNFLLRRNRPISYFTTGQSVPEDIEPATRKMMGELVLRRTNLRPMRFSHEVMCYGSGQSA